MPTTTLTNEQLQVAYRKMTMIRSFEEKLVELVTAGKLGGFLHLSIGQEAVAAGVCTHLSERDYVATTHRGHGHCIAKGIRVNGMMAERIRHLMVASFEGEIDRFEDFVNERDEASAKRLLCRVGGIGPWVADLSWALRTHDS